MNRVETNEPFVRSSVYTRGGTCLTELESVKRLRASSKEHEFAFSRAAAALARKTATSFHAHTYEPFNRPLQNPLEIRST